MLVRGWSYDDRLGTGSALTWRTVLLWLVPLSGPPGSAWGIDWTTPLWFLSACLWLVLGTPALLWLYRRWPVRTMALPLISLLATTASVWTLSGRSGEVLLNLMVYAPAWLVGFAHHDNRIRALPRLRVAGIALTLMATGLYYALTHQDPESGWDITGVPLAHSLWGTGVVLLLLRLDGLGSGLAARPRLGRALAVVNARAVTVLPVDQPRHHARRRGHRCRPGHAGRGRDGGAGAAAADRPEWAAGRADRTPARSGRRSGLPT